MASQVAHLRNVLADSISPTFMQLDSICAPPIQFSLALSKARDTTTHDLDKLMVAATQDNAVATMREARATVRSNFKLTFAFLTLQVHARGSQEFWTNVHIDQLYAYLFFKTYELYADVLSHLTAVPETMAIAALLEDIGSADFRTDVRLQLFDRLLLFITEQRQQHDRDWMPAEVDVTAIMTLYRQRSELAASQSLYMHLGLGILLAGAAILLWRRLVARS